MLAKSIKGKSTEEIKLALEQSMQDGFNPTLAIVFISIKQDRKAITELFYQNGIDVFGATSCGEFTDGNQDTGSAVILLLDIKKEHYSILFEAIGDRTISDVATVLAKEALKKFKRPAFILCSTAISLQGEMMSGEAVVESIKSVIGPHIKFYGGMAGDDGTFSGTYVFANDKETDIGLAALVLDEEKISLHGMSMSGWKTIGITRTVTKSDGPWVLEIDNQPALDLYLRYLGEGVSIATNKYGILEETGVYYPFQVEDDSEPMMRTPMEFDKDRNAVKVDFEIVQGTKFKFSVPPDFDIVETVLENAAGLKNETGEDAEALLVFSCAGRLNALGPLAKMENDGLSELWNAPMAGFFTYGEYGMKETGQQTFCSTTNSWVALKEKK
ncbi:MAG: FIST C-terminal domain-containing protein [Bacteroidetes bacterium]|nr:FIST C-terminal domain-containing protein [Bacteroidota bacterium]